MAIDYGQIKTAEQRQAEALTAAKERGRHNVDVERDGRIARGFTWNGIPVDTRDSRDFDNIGGLAQMAQQLAAMGDTSSTLPFRDADDVTHSLTPQEMMALGDAAFMHKSAHYAAAWDLKDAIDAAEDIEGVDAVNIYDDTAWP